MNNGTFGLPNQFADTRGSDKVIRVNLQTISGNVSIPANMNGVSAGPITIANGAVVTVENGATWTIV
jgi:hypothetical protein